MCSHFYTLICKIGLKVNLHREIQIEIQKEKKINNYLEMLVTTLTKIPAILF